MLMDQYADRLDALPGAPGDWHPFPAASDRAGWDGLPPEQRVVLVAAAERRLGFEWPALPATLIMTFLRTGDRAKYQERYFARRRALAELVLGECIEDRGRFLDDIIDGIWCICEESSWSVPAHLCLDPADGWLPDPCNPMVDLFAAETGALLAWTRYLLRERLDRVALAPARRIGEEIRERMLDPLLARDDFGWMAAHRPDHPNNWNPWIVSNWLAAALLIEEDPARRIASVRKAITCLDHYIDRHPADGGCDEGSNYWTRAGAALFDGLEWLCLASGGTIDVYDEPLIGSIAAYIVKVHIADSWFVNFADASARLNAPVHAVYGYGVHTGQEDLKALGAWLGGRMPAASPRQLAGDLGRTLLQLFDVRPPADTDAQPPLRRDAWLPVLQLVAARDREGSAAGWFLAAKGGHNGESHNHNDVGTFMVYRDGRPLLVDAGVGEYTRRTFGPERYSIWTMQSAYHNGLPVLDGIMQEAGNAFAARDVERQADDRSAMLALDLAAAYPAAAGLKFWRRRICLERGRQVTVDDVYELEREIGEIRMSFLTPSLPELESDRAVTLTARPLPEELWSAAGRLRVEASDVKLAVETMAIDDARLSPVWGDDLYRIVLTVNKPDLRGSVRIEMTA